MVAWLIFLGVFVVAFGLVAIAIAVYRLLDGGQRRFDFWRRRNAGSVSDRGVWFLVYFEAFGAIFCALCMIAMAVCILHLVIVHGWPPDFAPAPMP